MRVWRIDGFPLKILPRYFTYPIVFLPLEINRAVYVANITVNKKGTNVQETINFFEKKLGIKLKAIRDSVNI